MNEEIKKIVAGGLFKTRMPLIANPEDCAPDVAYRDAETFLEFLEEKGFKIIKI